MQKIYHSEIPEWLKEYAACESLERLKHVDMNCGMMYTACRLFVHTGWFSRFDHSLDTALIVLHFTDDRIQTLAALCHDIAAPVFSHTVDFAMGDYMKEEATEGRTEWIIRHDEKLMSLLQKDGIDVDEIKDYHMYPIADNDSPRLSSDRLEYTLSNAVNYGFAGEEEIKKVYDDILAGTDKEGVAELQFAHQESAEQFERWMLRCSKVYTADDDRYGMEMLARLLNAMLADHCIKEEDLYTREDEFIRKYFSSGKYAEKWKHFCHLCGTDESETGIVIHAKKRWINPIVKGRGRILDINEELGRTVTSWLKESQNRQLEGVYKDGK